MSIREKLNAKSMTKVSLDVSKVNQTSNLKLTYVQVMGSDYLPSTAAGQGGAQFKKAGVVGGKRKRATN